MSPETARRVSLSLAVLALTLTVTALVFSVVDGDRLNVARDAFIWAITLVFLVAGHAIATRQPGNPIGWLFLGGGVAAALSKFLGAYADYWLDTGEGSRTLGEAAAVYSGVSWVPFVLVPATFLLLLFPDGRLLTSRWRPVAWCAAVGIAGLVVGTVLTPGGVEDHPGFTNPYGVESDLLKAAEGPIYLVLLIGLVGSAVSLVLRFRQARGAQREQMKWIALAGAIVAVTIPSTILSYETIGQTARDGAIMLSILGLPAATTVAVLRYRLYDIDVVINRTLVYGSLTAILAGVYVGSVLFLQLALSDLTQGSGLAVAASTLAVAALFRPVRDRDPEPRGSAVLPQSLRRGADRRVLRRPAARRGRSRCTECRPPGGGPTRRCGRPTCRCGCAPGVRMSAHVEPEWAMVTVMFVDIRGFTTFADRSTAREAIGLPERVLRGRRPGRAGATAGTSTSCSATACSALFGAPEPLPDHADRALAAGRAMLEAVDARMGDRCRIGIGLNSGLVLVGTIGRRRLHRAGRDRRSGQRRRAGRGGDQRARRAAAADRGDSTACWRPQTRA